MPRAAQVLADEVEEFPETTVRDDIEAARDEIAGRGGPTNDDAGNETSTHAREGGRTAERAGGDAAAGGRDPSGRFTRRDGAGERGATGGVQPGAEGNTQAQGTGAQPPVNGAEPAPNTALAPQGWTPAGKAIWGSLPEAARAEILRREQDVHRAITKQDEERQVARQFNEITQTAQDLIQQTGLHPLRIYQDFLGYAKVLNQGTPQQRAMLLRDVAMRHGIDPRALAGVMPPPAPNSPQAAGPSAAPPQLSSLPPEVQDTIRWAKETQERQQREAKAAEESAKEKTLQEIVAFRSRPEARFFDAVQNRMIGLLQSGECANLEEAYNAACWGREDIRQILMAEEANKANAERERQRKAAAARTRGGSVRGSVGASADAGGPANRSLREELQANFAEARSRI